MKERIRTNEQNAETIWDACQGIGKIDPQDFAKIERDGNIFSLSECVPVITRITDIFAHITLEDIESIPDGQRGTLSNEVYQAQNMFHDIEHADPQQLANRSEMLQRVKNTYHGNRQNLAWIMAYIRPDLSGQREMRNKQRQMDAILSQVETRKSEADNLLKQMQGVAAELGVSEHAMIFKKVARRHAVAKYIWLSATVVLAGVTAYVGWALTTQPIGSDVEMIQYVVARLFVLGVLSYVLVWSGRTYRAEAHNEIVNAHRCEALRTFKVFTNAAGQDQATKNAVLIQSTQCIFAHRPSGFAQHDDAVPSSHMLELTRSIAGGQE